MWLILLNFPETPNVFFRFPLSTNISHSTQIMYAAKWVYLQFEYLDGAENTHTHITHSNIYNVSTVQSFWNVWKQNSTHTTKLITHRVNVSNTVQQNDSTVVWALYYLFIGSQLQVSHTKNCCVSFYNIYNVIYI